MPGGNFQLWLIVAVVFNIVCLCLIPGNCSCLFQKILFVHFSDGVSSERNLVSFMHIMPHSNIRLLWWSCDYSLCCAYLALKVEEYNLNVDQFVHVLMTDLREPAAEMILSYEVSLFCGWGSQGSK